MNDTPQMCWKFVAVCVLQCVCSSCTSDLMHSREAVLWLLALLTTLLVLVRDTGVLSAMAVSITASSALPALERASTTGFWQSGEEKERERRRDRRGTEKVTEQGREGGGDASSSSAIPNLLHCCHQLLHVRCSSKMSQTRVALPVV